MTMSSNVRHRQFKNTMSDQNADGDSKSATLKVAVDNQIPVKDVTPAGAVTPIKIHKPAKDKDDKHTPRSRIYVREVQGALETFRRFFWWFLHSAICRHPLVAIRRPSGSAV